MKSKQKPLKRKAQARRVAHAAAPIKPTNGLARNGRANPGSGKRSQRTRVDPLMAAVKRARARKPAGSQRSFPEPRYNQPGVRFDSGLRYVVADPEPPVNDGGKIALNLRGRTDTGILTLAGTHIEMVSTDPLFTGLTLMPTAAEFLAARDAFAAELAAFNVAKAAFRDATQRKDDARAALEVAFNVRAPYVQSVTNFNKAEILATGLPLRAEPTPMPPLQPPQNLRIDLNGTPGVMFATWMMEARARGYLIQWSLADTAERDWSEPLNSTNRKVTFTGMQIGKMYAFRIASLGTDSTQSLWSAEQLRMAA